MRTGDESTRGPAAGAAANPGRTRVATPASTGVEPRVGDRIGPYRLVRLLGAGAAGRVFEVEHQRLGRRAAMKTLALELAAHPGAIKRLFHEAMAVNRISNPHIVEVTDLVEGGEHRRAPEFAGAVCATAPVNAIVMELLEGQSLAQAMVRDGPLDPERFLTVLAQVARALAAAHAVGFVHRDLKPDNIFLVERGRDEDFVKLLDFGLTKALGGEAARHVPPADTASSSTLDGVFVGTPAYVSPEQASGLPVDHRGDIYALGVILFELITGRLPFEGPSSAEFLIQHVSVPAPHLPAEVRATKLGAMLDAIAQRCLEKDPAARFPSAAPLGRMFDDLARGGEVAFTGIGGYMIRRAAERAVPARRELVRAVSGVGIGLLLALVTGATVAHLRAPHDTAARSARAATTTTTTALPRSGAAAVLPAQVTLTFDSDPTGAEVFIDVAGHAERLGITPFERRFPRSGDVIPFEIQLAGHASMRVPTPMTSSRAISVTLTPEAPAQGRPLGIEPYQGQGR
jgi:serine/threonine-protein kinase